MPPEGLAHQTLDPVSKDRLADLLTDGDAESGGSAAVGSGEDQEVLGAEAPPAPLDREELPPLSEPEPLREALG